jgi:hypothetical protein
MTGHVRTGMGHRSTGKPSWKREYAKITETHKNKMVCLPSWSHKLKCMSDVTDQYIVRDRQVVEDQSTSFRTGLSNTPRHQGDLNG